MTNHPGRAMLQGVLMGTAVAMRENQGPLYVTNVEQDTDEDGVYLPYFDVTLFSGAVIRVTVQIEDPAAKVTDAEERIVDIERRIRGDIETTLGKYGIHAGFNGMDRDTWEDLASDLTNDALHQCEQLLTEQR
jgi:hypothetical protein